MGNKKVMVLLCVSNTLLCLRHGTVRKQDNPVWVCPAHCANFVLRAAQIRLQWRARLTLRGGAIAFPGSPTQFYWRSAAPEALLYGAKSDTGANAEKQWAVRTVQSPRVRESDRQGPTVRLPGHKGDTLTGGVWLRAFGKADVSSSGQRCPPRGGRGVRAELLPMCQWGRMNNSGQGTFASRENQRPEGKD
jgi:hypothetical protein